MRQRVSILLVILVRLGVTCEYPKPLLRAMFPHFMSACRRFPTWLIFYFANSDRIQHGMRQSLRIGRRDNTDQLSIRSSSVLTALIAPNVRFPTLSYASRCALPLLLHASCLPCQLCHRCQRLSALSFVLFESVRSFSLEKVTRIDSFDMILTRFEPGSHRLQALI